MLVVIPKGIFKRTIYTNTASNSAISVYTITYPDYRGFTLSASSLDELYKLIDWFWMPTNRVGANNVTELNTLINRGQEVTQVIELESVQ